MFRKILSSGSMRVTTTTATRIVPSTRPFSLRASLLREAQYDYAKISALIHSSSSSSSSSSTSSANSAGDGTTRLIDVREPDEFSAGHIPTSRNVPLSGLEGALSMAPAAFRATFGFERPSIRDPVVFYCKAGVRSSTASRIAEARGWERVGNYKGSWSDFVARQGRSNPASSPPPPPSSSTTTTTTTGGGNAGAKRLYSTKTGNANPPNPNLKDGAGEGAEGGIDLKKMNQREEKRAEGKKQREKEGKGTLAGAKDGEESESVRSGAELAGGKKFE